MALAPQRHGDALIEHPAHRKIYDAFVGMLLDSLEVLGEARWLELGIL